MFNGIKDIEVGKTDDIIVLLKSISLQKSKSGSPYQKIIVRDRDGRQATFIQFDTFINIKPPAVVRARVMAVQYDSGISIRIRECAKTDECGIGPFLPKPHIEAKEAWSHVVRTVKSIRPGLGRIVCSIISENRNKFLTLPLHPSGAFARQSGILEATVKLLVLSEITAGQQGLDRDLMLAAAILYYSGHFDTVDSGYNQTVAGVMYGPSAIAAHKVQMKSMTLAASDREAKNEISQEDVLMLCHILTAGGNSVTPAIPEAAALIHLDRLLQEVDEMNESLADAEDMISVDPNHFNRFLYKAQGKR